MASQPSLLDGPSPSGGGPSGPGGGAPDSGHDAVEASGRVVDIDIGERMERSFLDYSMSVIVGRALPDVRDGLKPVQRRILYAMWEAGLRPDRPYRKCASAVGDVMKKYHPHGDTSIYDALVRMAQDFSSRAPLVDGHGNFGSVDGDAAAAMRYTEARLSALAMELLDGIDEDTVDLVPNYDGYERQPVVLPARFPNLLVNGVSGIAVGMATNIPPHHLGETVAACRHLLAHPDASLDDLMAIVPAPDFPTGARILDTPGIRDAYATGRGPITMEAVATTETRAGGLPRIVVTELPYQVNKSMLLERIAELVRARKVEAIRDLRDESSRDGMRVVVELKRGEDPASVLDALYRLTDLRTNFNVNLVALVDGADGRPQPRTLGLRDALLAYVSHQRAVLTRRSAFRRRRAADRAHVLEGLLVALDAIDEVVAIIRGADSADEARTALMGRFDLSEVQATAILDMQLRRLAALERRKLADELAALRDLIAQLDRVLADPTVLDRLLDTELAAVARRHADPRRSRLVPAGAVGGDGDTAAPRAGVGGGGLDPQPVLVTVTAGAVIRATARRRTSPSHAGGRDALAAALRTTTGAALLVVGDRGGGHVVAAADVPVVQARQRGVPLGQLLGGRWDEAPAAALVLDLPWVVTVSAAGLVKRTARADVEGRAGAVAGVRPGDRIVAAVGCGEGDHLLLAHAGGLVIRFPVAEVRPTGRGALGVAGLKVPPGGRVAAASVVPADGDADVLTLAGDGTAKRSPLAAYPVQGRGGRGVQAGAAPLAWCGLATDLHVPTAGGWTVLTAAAAVQAQRTSRGTPATDPVEGAVVPEWPPAAA